MENSNLNPAALAVAKEFDKLTKGFKLAPGEHEVSGRFEVEVSGMIKKGEDSQRTPTVSIPYKVALALVLEKAGVVGDAAAKMLRDAMTEAIDLSKDKDAKAALSERCKCVEVAEQRVQDMLDDLPKVTVSGRTTMKDCEVTINEVTHLTVS